MHTVVHKMLNVRLSWWPRPVTEQLDRSQCTAAVHCDLSSCSVTNRAHQLRWFQSYVEQVNWHEQQQQKMAYFLRKSGKFLMTKRQFLEKKVFRIRVFIFRIRVFLCSKNFGRPHLYSIFEFYSVSEYSIFEFILYMLFFYKST